MSTNRTLATLAATAAVFALPAGALAQAVEPPADLVEEGALTYGVAATFAPFEYMEDGELAGFDIEFGAAIADAMGLEPNPLNMEFSGLIPALQGGRIDIINSAMYINEERSAQVDFVPYMLVGNEIVVPRGNPEGIASREDLCGLTVAVTLGGIQETYAREDAARCENAGEETVTVLTLPTAQDSALSVRQGRADAFFNATPGAMIQVQELPDVYEIVGETFEANTQIGIAVRKGDDDLRAAIEAAIQQVVEDGTYAELMEKYDFPPSVALF
jgi:polar amino acid transport system substrate-binding protein